MSSTNETVARSPAPVDPRQRIEVVDMVRGFALFGVLLVNMFNFGAYSIVWNEPGDELALLGMQFFFETKSWRLFSFLFGFGFALQLIRAEERGSKFAPVYLRRLVILFVIGAGHAMIYDEDILMLYAELGLVLVLFRNVPPRLLLVLSVGLLAVNPIGKAVTLYLEPMQAAPTTDSVRFEEDTAKIEGCWTISSDGLSLFVDHVWHTVLWFRLWQRLLAGTGGGHGICRFVFRASDRVFCLVDKEIPLWTDGVVMARPNVPRVSVNEGPSTISWRGLKLGLPDRIALPS